MADREGYTLAALARDLIISIATAEGKEVFADPLLIRGEGVDRAYVTTLANDAAKAVMILRPSS